jgi:hypothetical protein
MATEDVVREEDSELEEEEGLTGGLHLSASVRGEAGTDSGAGRNWAVAASWSGPKRCPRQNSCVKCYSLDH